MDGRVQGCHFQQVLKVADCIMWLCADVWNAPGLEIKAIASYKGPELPPDEEERMRTVCCAVQDDKDDAVLSSICKLVCSLLKVPSAGKKCSALFLSRL